ncbi:SIR2 family protein, partial [Geminicoccus roseus]|uniref:SIR2 family protein n=1 Tax=Geminicoccus roseus TaxID=404900 RepID=UPI00196A0775
MFVKIMRKKDFIETYSKFVLQGNAGLFLGAGLSINAGYPSWRQLVQDMAKEIDLDASLETDLAGLVQFALNKSGRTRTRLVRLITDHFGEEKPIPDVFRILARLPITRVWTTNYDTLIERSWRAQRKRLDVKSYDKDVMTENPWSHAILYKMHGTVEHPSDVVISKSDYEEYRRKRASFLHLLMGQLISHHMLFLGLSFTDPNLSYLFMMIREAFDHTPPEHFSIVRKPSRGDYSSKKLFD